MNEHFEFVSWSVSLITMDDFMHTQGPPLKKYLDFEVLISGQVKNQPS